MLWFPPYVFLVLAIWLVKAYICFMNRPRKTRTNYSVQQFGDYASLGAEYVYHVMTISADEEWGAWYEFKLQLGATL